MINLNEDCRYIHIADAFIANKKEELTFDRYDKLTFTKILDCFKKGSLDITEYEDYINAQIVYKTDMFSIDLYNDNLYNGSYEIDVKKINCPSNMIVIITQNGQAVFSTYKKGICSTAVTFTNEDDGKIAGIIINIFFNKSLKAEEVAFLLDKLIGVK